MRLPGPAPSACRKNNGGIRKLFVSRVGKNNTTLSKLGDILRAWVTQGIILSEQLTITGSAAQAVIQHSGV